MKKSKKPVVKKPRNHTVLSLTRILENLPRAKWNAPLEEIYSICSERAPIVSSSLIEKFSQFITGHEYQGIFKNNLFSYAGQFVTSLINKSIDENFMINTGESSGLWHLCYGNKKNVNIIGNTREPCFGMSSGKVTIHGSAGDNAGNSMTGGKLIIQGSAGIYLGMRMNNGEICVNGYVGACAGEWMQNGKIEIQGSAGHCLGERMSGGIIHLQGNADWGAGNEMEGGEIFIQGDAGYSLGRKMKGGKIHLQGNTSEWLGALMEGGEIRIDGDYKGLFEKINGGKIIQRGVQIMPPCQPLEK